MTYDAALAELTACRADMLRMDMFDRYRTQYWPAAHPGIPAPSPATYLDPNHPDFVEFESWSTNSQHAPEYAAFLQAFEGFRSLNGSGQWDLALANIYAEFIRPGADGDINIALHLRRAVGNRVARLFPGRGRGFADSSTRGPGPGGDGSGGDGSSSGAASGGAASGAGEPGMMASTDGSGAGSPGMVASADGSGAGEPGMVASTDGSGAGDPGISTGGENTGLDGLETGTEGTGLGEFGREAWGEEAGRGV